MPRWRSACRLLLAILATRDGAVERPRGEPRDAADARTGHRRSREVRAGVLALPRSRGSFAAGGPLPHLPRADRCRHCAAQGIPRPAARSGDRPVRRLPHRAQGPRGRHRQARDRVLPALADRLSAARRARDGGVRGLPHGRAASIARRRPHASIATRTTIRTKASWAAIAPSCHEAGRLGTRAVRSRQDQVRADRQARASDLRRLPCGQPLHQDTPTQCAACHAPDDVHAGARGAGVRRAVTRRPAGPARSTTT